METLTQTGGFKVRGLLMEDDRFRILRATRESDGATVCLKTTVSAYPEARLIAILKNEFSVASQLKSGVIPRYLEKFEDGNKLYLVMENFSGMALPDYLENESPEITEKLKIAVQMGGIIEDLWKHNLVHKDLRTDRFIYDPQSQVLHLVHFGSAGSQTRQSVDQGNTFRQLADLAYVSPEQTGRTSWGIDHRSDLYAFGICLYEIFTGRLPFEGKDSLELLYMQVAGRPLSPRQQDDEIPEGLSGVIEKLLEKAPGDRYQSIHGVNADLAYILKHLQDKAALAKFRVAAWDRPDRLKTPDEMHGRQDELSLLEMEFRKACEGDVRIMLLEGQQGVGKTFLVQAFRNGLLRVPHLYSAGRFEQFNKDFTKGGLIASVRQILSRFLALDTTAFSEFRENLEKDLDKNLGLLLRVLPELGLFYKDLEAPAPLEGNEEQNRFFYAFRLLLRSLSSPEMPLVIFLDDLQWADYSSLRLLEEIAVAQELSHIFVIGCFRQTEVGKSHPLNEVVTSLTRAGMMLKLHLNPLGTREIHAWLDDVLGPNPHNGKLTELVERRTRGLPFFIQQFLLLVFDKGLLQYEPEGKFWQFDLDQVGSLEMTDRIGDVIKSRLNSLSAAELEALQVAAILGYRFRESDIADLTGEPVESVIALLDKASDLGIVIPDETGWVQDKSTEIAPFTHRFLQQSLRKHFYENTPDKDREEIHYRIGKIRLASQPEEGPGQDYFFEMLQHLNLGKSQITEREEAENLALMNLEGGKQAYSANAYEQALFYLESGRDLILNFSRKSLELSEIVFWIGKSKYLLGDYESAEAELKQLVKESGDFMFRLKVAKELCRLFITVGNHEESLKTGLKVIQESKYAMPVPKGQGALRFAIIRKMLRLRMKLTTRKFEKLRDLPRNEDPELSAFLRSYEELMVSALSVNPTLFALLVLQQVQITLKYGLTPFSGPAFISFAILNAVGVGDYKTALNAGKAAVELVNIPGLGAKRTEIRFADSHFLLHLKDEIRDHLEVYLDIHRHFIEIGDPIFAGYSLNSRIWSMVALGINLDEIGQEMDAYIRNFRLKGEQEVLDMMVPRRQFIRGVQGQLTEPWTLSDESYHFENKFTELKERGSYSVLGGMVLAKIQIDWLFHRYSDGISWCQQGEPYLPNMEGIYFTCEYYLYTLLNHLGEFISFGRKPESGELKKLKAYNKKLKKLYGQQPGNYESHYLLFHAGFLHLEGKLEKAELAYSAAIASAKKLKFWQNYAVANEIAFQLSRQLGRKNNEVNFLKDARQGYLIWGATAKVNQLDRAYSDFLGDGSSPVSDTGSDVLELNTLLKASNALSQEIRLHTLLQALLRILMENAGATRGCFVMPHEGVLIAEIEGEMAESGFQAQVLGDSPDPNRFPLAVIRYVARTGEAVTQNSGFSDLFHDDPYLESVRPKSFLCHPVIHQGQFLGLIYLENQLVSNSFSPARIELLSLLSGQIGISIQNAKLYENLEKKVADRTRELAEEKKKSEDLLLNILPEHTAGELMATGKTHARKYEKVTILFTDIVGFTPIVEQLSAENLVNMLDTYFSECDKIVEKHQLEKIKTIGDAYLCAGGLHEKDPESAKKVVDAGLEMIELVDKLKDRFGEFKIRVGIHTGPVVAGVVGTKKFAYDIWGDAVNIASRMESAGEPNRVNISETTYQLVKDDFECDYRGKVKAKNKGELPMYFVRKPDDAPAAEPSA